MARVALVCEPPDGGTAAHVRWLARGLPSHGYEPVVVVPPDFAHLEEMSAECEVVTVPFRRDYAHPNQDLRVMARLVPVLRGTALVHAHSAKAGAITRVLAGLVRRPAVYTPHLFPFVGEISSTRRHFSIWTERALAPFTAALICVCEFELGLAQQKRLHVRRIALVYNGCPPCGDAHVASNSEGLIIGTVCVLRRQKALETLLEAMPAIATAVPEAKLVIVGEGPHKAELHKHADTLGVDVTWLPFEPPSSRYLHAFDVYVLSSAWEAGPIAVLEAQACGVPQVVTAVGGTQELVAPETGVVVPPRDPNALAEAIIQLLRDPQRRAAMGDASRARHAEHFTADRMAARTAAVYDQVLGDQ